MEQEETHFFATIILILHISHHIVYQGPPEIHEEAAFCLFLTYEQKKEKKEDVLYYLAQGRTFPLHQVTSDLCVRALYCIPVFTPCTHRRIFYLTPSSLLKIKSSHKY